MIKLKMPWNPGQSAASRAGDRPAAELRLRTQFEVAEFLHVEPSIVKSLLESGELEGSLIAREWRIPVGAVSSYLERTSTRARPLHRTRRRWIGATLAIAGMGAVVGGSSVLFADDTAAADSTTIPYQGYLENGGIPVDGSKALTFCLAKSSSGACEWSESHIADVKNGHFTAALGETNPLDSLLASSGSLYVDVTVSDVDDAGVPLGESVQLAGRQLLGSVPFARRGAPGKDFVVDGNVEFGGNLHLAGRVRDHSGLVTPVGAIVPFGGSVVPDGWLLCDGTAVDSSEYGELYEAIGNAWGDGGDGAGPLFTLPDLRGRFLRGVDTGVGDDPDRATRTASGPNGNTGDAVGSRQDSALGQHAHQVHGTTSHMCYGDACRGVSVPVHREDEPLGYPTTEVGGAETRPINVYVSYIIKY